MSPLSVSLLPILNAELAPNSIATSRCPFHMIRTHIRVVWIYWISPLRICSINESTINFKAYISKCLFSFFHFIWVSSSSNTTCQEFRIPDLFSSFWLFLFRIHYLIVGWQKTPISVLISLILFLSPSLRLILWSTVLFQDLFFSFFFFLSFCYFFGLLPGHMEVPRLGVESEL